VSLTSGPRFSGMRQSLLPMLTSLAGLACAPATRISSPPGSPVAPVRSYPVPIGRATWQTLAAFNAAAQSGDTARMATVFAEDAILISPRGDSIRGRNAIMQYLTHLVPEATSARFSFGRDGPLEVCGVGARERLTYTAGVGFANQTSTTVSGTAAVFWRRDSAGGIEVAWATLSELEIERHLRQSECPTHKDLVWRAWRDSVRSAWQDSVWRAWRVAVSLFPVPLAGTGPTGSFAGVLRARGWVDESCSCFAPPCLCFAHASKTPLSGRVGLLPQSLVGVQYHWRRHVMTEIVALRVSSWTMGAQFFSNRNYGQTRLSVSGIVLGAVVSCERRGMQLGIGPALQITRWRLSDSLIPYSTGGNPSYTVFRWSKGSPGVIGDVRYNRLFKQGTFISFRAQLRRFPRTATPATPDFPAAMIDQGGSFVGIGGGILF
jgi:SnoaL-like domain